MVENERDDDVDPRPAKDEASGEASGVGSGDVKPKVDPKPFKVKIPFQASISKVGEKPKPSVVGNACNTTSFFATNEKWSDREELLGWLRRQAARAGFMIVIDKSVIKRPYLTMQCERSGKYKPPSVRKKAKIEGLGSRKCECPFSLKGFFDTIKKEWSVGVLCGMHNHEMEKKLQGHILCGKLNPEEKKKVIGLTKSLVVPRNILNNLKQDNEASQTVIKQVYNVRSRWRKGQRGDLTEMQFLMKSLEENKYVHYERCNGEETILQDIFFTHPHSIKLLNTFPTVLVMDSTYKTNTYRMPLLEIVGCTATRMTYSVGFAFLAKEQEEHFTWALEMVKGLLSEKEEMPKVIVTDRDTALMNAVATVFPKAANILCHFHIYKNVKAKCITDCRVKPKPPKGAIVDKKQAMEDKEKNRDVVGKITKAWKAMVECQTEEAYEGALLELKELCMPFPHFIKYFETTVLNVKDKFVRAWTDKVLNLGNRTTNIVESAHGQLKRYLRSSVGDLPTCWDEINKMLVAQFGEIQASFGRNKTVFEHKYKKIKMMKPLEGYVSRKALRFIYDELVRSKTFGFAKKDCGCVQMTMYGLPCACIIAMKSRKKMSLSLDDIYPHWRTLHVQGEKIDENFSVMEEWNGIQQRLETCPYEMKLYIKEKLRELAFPEATNMDPPKKVVTKGAQKRKRNTDYVASTGRIRSKWEVVDSQNPDSQPSQPKKSLPRRKDAGLGNYSRSQASSSKGKAIPKIPYISQIPTFMRPFVEDIVNVRGDGHCGFRVVARHLWKNDEDHVLVRQALIHELKTHKSDYMPIYTTEERYKVILDGLHPPIGGKGIVPMEKWLTTPDMGHLIATCYNRPVVQLTLPGLGRCETYFPIRGPPTINPHSNIMCLLLIPDHFLHVTLKEGCPLPPSCEEWNNCNIGEAEQWLHIFLDRIDAFRVLMSKEPKPPKKPTNEANPIVCDTPTPTKKEFETMEEDEYLSLDFLDSI